MTAVLRSSQGYFPLRVMAYSTTIGVPSESAQLMESSSHYPIKPAQPNFSFVNQFESPEELRRFQIFIRVHQMNSHSKDIDDSKLTFIWPENDMMYEGYVLSFPGGEQRFDVAPQANIQMYLIKDMFSVTTDRSSTSAGLSKMLGEQYEWTGTGEYAGNALSDAAGVMASVTPKNTDSDTSNFIPPNAPNVKSAGPRTASAQ